MDKDVSGTARRKGGGMSVCPQPCHWARDTEAQCLLSGGGKKNKSALLHAAKLPLKDLTTQLASPAESRLPEQPGGPMNTMWVAPRGAVTQC